MDKLDKRQKYLILGGTLLAGGLVGLIFLYKEIIREEKEYLSTHSKKHIIRILKEIIKEKYSIFKQISPLCKEIVEKEPTQLSSKQIQDLLLQKHQINLSDSLVQCEARVLQRHGIAHENFEHGLKIYEKYNLPIKKLISQQKENREKALRGNFELYAEELPHHVTPEFTIEIYRKLKQKILVGVYEGVLEKGLRRGDAGLEEIDREIQFKVYTEAGLNGFDDAPEQILATAIKRYSKLDSGFGLTILGLEDKSKEILNDIFRGESDILNKIDAL